MEEIKLNRVLDWGVASQKLKGQKESGDLHLVKPFSNGMLVAVIDGLGHGSLAAQAAQAAADILSAFPHKSIIWLVEQCHRFLKETRGVAISLASFNTLSETLTWLGVGNVEGIIFYSGSHTEPAQKSLLLRPGIVGCTLPRLDTTTIPIIPGDTLILTTDGIDYNFSKRINLKNPPRQIAENIMKHHAKGNDDALVLVARYLGGIK
jgi:negative regulator of sigma-B (phosphoserine phosphatase)